MAEAYHTFRNIACTIDGSFHSFITSRYSLVLAGSFNTRLYIVTVLTDRMSKREKEDASSSVVRIIDEARRNKIDAGGIILEGDVLKNVEEFVSSHDVGLVIASTRRPHREKRFFVKSVTSALMRRLPCNVVGVKVAHPGRSIAPRKILVPIIGDGFKDRERAEIIRAFTERFNSRITVFHVVEIGDMSIRLLDRDMEKDLQASGEERIESFMRELAKRDISATEKIVVGSKAREEIILEASHHKYDLIIVGATMRNILKRIVSGKPQRP